MISKAVLPSRRLAPSQLSLAVPRRMGPRRRPGVLLVCCLAVALVLHAACCGFLYASGPRLPRSVAIAPRRWQQGQVLDWERQAPAPRTAVAASSEGSGHGTDGELPHIEYTSLVEASLPDVDLNLLGQELLAETWSQESLMVKALLREGAQNIEVLSQRGKDREMTFLMRTGIPWSKVLAFFRMQGKAKEADAAVTGKEGLSSVVALHRLEEASAESVRVKSTYVVKAPRMNLHMDMRMQNGRFSYDGGIEFFSWPSENFDMLQYGVVRKFMEASFMKAMEHLGKTTLAELGRRAGGS